MKEYIGTKRLKATPMTRKEYVDLRQWTLPVDENGDDPGYLVEYIDGGQANVSGFAGYVSWSPEPVFVNAYRPTTAMNFGDALAYLKAGYKVSRAGWNARGQWLCYIRPGSILMSGVPLAKFETVPFIVIKPAYDKIVPWLPSQTDMLAEDWTLVE